MRGTAILAGLLAAVLSAGPAWASAGFSCEIKDRNAELSVEGAGSRGTGGAVMNFGGSLQVLAKAVPDDLRTSTFEREHLTQSWIASRDLKLWMYREREGNALPHGTVELVLEARRTGGRDEPEYAGTYVLTVYFLPSASDSEGRTVTLRGKAKCSAE